MNWDTVTELAALIVLGTVAIVSMYELGIEGKEIPLAIGSGIVGYLVKAAVNTVRKQETNNENPS